ncbi:MAG: alpha/beta hydrolase [Lachnospiraceae bacterium]|nr:alpha/beta hydrolase [Lachnospiraceae bacterium]
MEQHIELDDTYMNVIKFGSGKKILTVIAGISLCGLEGLGNQIENNFRFLTSDFTVYIFDRKKVLPENYTMTDMAEDIFLCLNQLGISKTSLYGISQGGMISMLFAIHHPELVEKLVLCSTSAKVENTNKAFSEWKKASDSENITALNQSFLDYVYSDSYKEAIKEYIPQLLEQGTMEDLKRFLILLKSMENFDITNLLNSIKCPTLVICDMNDKIFNYKCSNEIAEKIGFQPCKTFLYNQYSHAVYDESPDVLKKVAEFCK